MAKKLSHRKASYYHGRMARTHRVLRPGYQTRKTKVRRATVARKSARKSR